LLIKSKFFVGAVLILSIISGHAAEERETLSITIDTVSLGKLKFTDTLDILLTTKGYPVGGIVLKFGHDSPIFDIETIVAGKIPDSCIWKVFNSREAMESGTEGRPKSMWQLLAMAEFGPDTLRSACNSFAHTESIARLIVTLDTSKLSQPISDTLFPIYFYWESCSDNTMANVKGDSLFIAERVDGRHWTHAKVVNAGFPTRLGASSKCIDPRAKNPPQRRIHFQNGGVRIRTVVDNKANVE
jgi:hypothetical protein